MLEVGMGGRLDATNVVEPLLSMVTDISLDHTEWLGPTIGAITREKAGILRRGGTMITLPQHPEANQVLGEVAIRTRRAWRERSALHAGNRPRKRALYRVEALGRIGWCEFSFEGAHQHRNMALAIAAAVELSTTPRIGGRAGIASRKGFARHTGRAGWNDITTDGVGMDSRCGTQSRRRLGAACGLQQHVRDAIRECSGLQLPARQAY